MDQRYKYDVAISFAEEDRNVALCVALALEIFRFKNVYYYPDKREETWGKSLEKKLKNIYSVEAKYCIVILSKNYFADNKVYTKIEFEAIKQRILANGEMVYMLPLLLDEASLPILERNYSKMCWVKWEYNPKEIAGMIKQMLGQKLHSAMEEKNAEYILYKEKPEKSYIKFSGNVKISRRIEKNQILNISGTNNNTLLNSPVNGDVYMAKEINIKK
jgi:hypothetical protein